MDSSVLIVLIIAVAIVVIVILLRDRITEFFAGFSLRDQSGNVGVKAAKPRQSQPTPSDSHSVNISRNKQIGKGNVIEVGRSDVNVQDNTQLGEDQKIIAKSETERKKK